MNYSNYLQQKQEKMISDIDETISFVWEKQVDSPIKHSKFWMSIIDNLLDKRIETVNKFNKY